MAPPRLAYRPQFAKGWKTEDHKLAFKSYGSITEGWKKRDRELQALGFESWVFPSYTIPSVFVANPDAKNILEFYVGSAQYTIWAVKPYIFQSTPRIGSAPVCVSKATYLASN